MIKIKLLLLLCGLASISFAQEKGIKFRSFQNWEEVLTASKQESKPIFIDVYTTWCGPCKAMEQDVYTDDDVADYFNVNFISIKIQMDKTSKDDDQIKKWYGEQKKINEKFKISSFPTLLFVSSTGEVLNRYAGFRNSTALIKLAKDLKKAGFKYIDRETKYLEAVNNYYKKKITGRALIPLIHEAVDSVFAKPSIIDTLMKTFLSYSRNLPPQLVFKKEILELIARVNLSSSDPLLKLFKAHGKKIDDIVGEKGFAQLVLDRTIRIENFKFIPDNAIKVKFKKINWDSLYTTIKTRYGILSANRTIDAAKAWILFLTNDYQANPTYPDYLIEMNRLVNKYGSDVILIFSNRVDNEALQRCGKERLKAILFETLYFEHLRAGTYLKYLELLPPSLGIFQTIVSEAEKNKNWWFPESASTLGQMFYQMGDINKAIVSIQKAIEFVTKNPSHFTPTFLNSLERTATEIKSGTLK